MHENEFRHRFRASIGEAPDEAAAAQRAVATLHRGRAADEGGRHPRALAFVAMALTLLVLTSLLGPRIVRTVRTGGATSPAGAGAPPPSPASAPKPATACRLPMIVTDSRAVLSAAAAGADSNGMETETAGFVSLATGRFQADPTAVPDGMPFSRMYAKDVWRPQVYDTVLRRWLPVQSDEVSPDHGSYLYVDYSPLLAAKGNPFDSTTLHVYDVRKRTDRALWTYAGAIAAQWTARGIEATTTPRGGGQGLAWLVDPDSGAATAKGPAPPPDQPLIDRSYGIRTGGYYGTDGRGRPIIVEGGLNPGSHAMYFVGGPNGRRIVIHDGVAGPDAEFAPSGFAPDGDRLWMANVDGTAIWLWTERDGLKRFALSGVIQHDPYVTSRVVGPCL
ncbi:MAG TPA: hypothetical protein VOB72_18795 [Candidatus Dormibacteraeota bacterium]|nr:hypothetical protein [Candidatus Dormibacteraeota bacterium]